MTLLKFISGRWNDTYGPESKNFPKSVNMWLDRRIMDIGYSNRKKTISQKIPECWDTMAQTNAAGIRESFKEKKVEVLMNCDETYLRFHERDDHVLAPVGISRIGTNEKFDEKSGCTVMVCALC